jgi:hypothetical protein
MKKLFILILTVFILLIPVSALGATKTYDISSNKKITIDEGKKCVLSLPTKYKNVKWSSNDKEVVTINKTGSLTAVNGGKATITAKSGKKSFKCYVTVKEDYSEWVLYDTDDLETLLENIVDGYVVEINDEYYCSPEYFEMVSNAEVVYENDISDDEDYLEALQKIAEQEYINNLPTITLTPEMEIEFEEDPEPEDDEALKSRIKDMMENGKATSE